MKPLILTAVLSAACALSACDEPAATDGEGASSASATRSALGLPPLDANGAPQFRAGLWERTETRGGETGVYRECRAAGPDENLQALLAGERSNCETSRSDGGGALRISTRCRVEGGEVHSALSLSGDETSYRAQVDMTVLSQGQVQASDSVVAEARWLGDCPADMRPGDEVEMTP